MTKHICIISFSPIARDARVLRQIKYLGAHYDLTVIGFGDAHPTWGDSSTIQWRPVIRQPSTWGVRLSELALLTVAGYARPASYEHWYWRRPHRRQALEHAVAAKADLYHANDWEALPVAVEAASRHSSRVLFDAHEYSPLEFEERRTWRLLYARPITYFLHKYAAAVDGSTTVVSAIADRYRSEFGLDPVVVLNAPEHVNIPDHMLDASAIAIVHHGAALPGRRLELMIQALSAADRRFNLHFLLLGNQAYIRRLEALAARLAPGRVFFHAPVLADQVVQRIAEYDLGIFILPPVNYNWEVSLPNKLFDFINAGLGICVGPSPEMARLVQQYRCGVVAPSFDPADVATTLNRLTVAQIAEMRRQSRAACHSLNAEVEMAKVVALYRQLLQEPD